MGRVIIDFQINKFTLGSIPTWTLYYKNEDEFDFNVMQVDFTTLKLLIEHFGIETNNLDELKKLNFDLKNIKQNENL